MRRSVSDARARVAILPLAVCLIALSACAPLAVPSAQGGEARLALERPTQPPQVTVLDVGEGDAILLRHGDRAVLIDGGPSPERLKEALARQGVKKLDAVVLTHLHPDHSAGIEHLSETVPFEKLYSPAGFEVVVPSPTLIEVESAAGRTSERLAAGDGLDVGDIHLSVLWPPRGVDLRTQNENSLVALATTPAGSVLLAADAEAPTVESLIDSGKLGRVDVLKVGHHAAEKSVSRHMLEALRPRYAVVSVGEGNPYGYPKQAALSLLADGGVTTLRTDVVGDITIALGAPGAEIRR